MPLHDNYLFSQKIKTKEIKIIKEEMYISTVNCENKNFPEKNNKNF